MNKNPFILSVIALCGIALIGSVILWIAIAREHALRKVDQTAQQVVPKLEVATDPSFPEIKGRVISGFPDFPVYPGAALVASAKTNRADQPDTGYRVKWTVQGEVPIVMKWYQAELPKSSWQIEQSVDPNNPGEQINQISKGNFNGSLLVENDGTVTEIIAEVLIAE